MKYFNKTSFRLASILLLFLITANHRAGAQTPTDLDFVPAKNLCPAVNYSYSSWNKYWQVDNLIENGNVGKVTTQKVAVGFNLGILDRLNFIAMLPYVFTHPSQGTLNSQHGIQDISLNVKGNYAELKLGSGQLKIVGNLGFSTPVTDYLVDFAPLNIGSGTTNFNYRQMFAYTIKKGFYAQAKANYTFRSNVPDIHRDYYYDDGNSYYENEVHVYDVFDWSVVLGFSNDRFKAEALYSSYNTLGGTDIRTWDAAFPANNVDANTIGANLEYYFKKLPGLEISAGAGYTVSGRNTGQSIFANIGVDYYFQLWGKNKTAD
ncbi:MAG TPA: transporter [Chitinophagales bacterium]|nr:transporter [Chitinophagales bacterium]